MYCGNSSTEPDSNPPGASTLSLEFTGDNKCYSTKTIPAVEVTSHFSERVANRLLTETSSASRSLTRSVNALGTCQVTAEWTECDDTDFNSYALYRSTTPNIQGDPSQATLVYTVSGSSTAISYVDNGVIWETKYYYALKTTDTEGLSSWSNEANITTPSESGDVTPSTLSVSFTGDTGAVIRSIGSLIGAELESTDRSSRERITLTDSGRGYCQVTANWTECPDSDFLNYTLYRSTNQNISQDTTNAVNLGTNTNSNATTIVDSLVVWETNYYYALITSVNQGNFAWSNETSITTPSESDEVTPSTLSLSFTGDTSNVDSPVSHAFQGRSDTHESFQMDVGKGYCEVTANWTECPDSDFLNYTLYRSLYQNISQDTTVTENLGSVSQVNDTILIDSSVEWETTYYYALITRDTGGNYAWSNETSIETPDSSSSADYPNELVHTIYPQVNPIDITLLPSGDYAYVVGWNSSPGWPDVNVIRLNDWMVTDGFEVGGRMKAISSSPTGDYVYVGCGIPPIISVIRTSDNVITDSIEVDFGSWSDPYGMCVSPSGDYLYATISHYDIVSVIDTAENEVIENIPVGDQPQFTCILPSGDYVYVSNTANSNVSVIRTSDNSVIKTLDMGSSSEPGEMCTSITGEYVYVVCDVDPPDSSYVAVINTIDNSVETTIGISFYSRDICPLPSGDYLFVTNQSSVTGITVIRTSDHAIIDEITFSGYYKADEICVTPDGEYAYVTDTGSSGSYVHVLH